MNHRNTVMCREDCNYRNRAAPFCGYCLYEIMLKNRKERSNGHRQDKDEDDRETEGRRL